MLLLELVSISAGVEMVVMLQVLFVLGYLSKFNYSRSTN